jgi:hypothetical protein
MIPHLRARFNAVYSEERYPALLQTLTAHFGEAPAFRVSETPIFVPNNLARQLLEACEEISDVLCRPDFKELTEPALHRPPSQAAPGEDDHPLFLQYDFAVTLDEMGRFVPYLIEMQGFPSLYFYQHMLALAYRECYDIPASLRHLFGGLDHEEYLNLLNEAIVAGHDPDHVVLLEVEPQLQKTRVDFWSAQRLLGIKTLCLSELKREGRDLYYLDAYQKRVPVRRIFNRVIFDELIKREELPRQFNLVEEVDVEWAGHPNWFSRVSKFTLPFIQSRYVPETFFLDQLDAYPDDLDNYVLKPLYSFSGQGVRLRFNADDLDAIVARDSYILQRRVNYAPVIAAPGLQPPSKCEIRMMLMWKNEWARPRVVNNLVRLTHGEMIGVLFNREDTWVGSSIGFFESTDL